MSHYITIVTGEDIEKQLAPYEEGQTFFETKDGNHKAKWDWFQIGGRWMGFLPLKKGKKGEIGRPGTFNNESMGGADIAKVGDVDIQKLEFLPHAILHEGIWHEVGEMGWFGAVGDKKDEIAWDNFASKLLKGLPKNTKLTVVDCHI